MDRFTLITTDTSAVVTKHVRCKKISDTGFGFVPLMTTRAEHVSERSGANVIKLFCPQFTTFCTKKLFARLGWKSWPGTNTLAYYKNS
jgi:hypothetical protein